MRTASKSFAHCRRHLTGRRCPSRKISDPPSPHSHSHTTATTASFDSGRAIPTLQQGRRNLSTDQLLVCFSPQDGGNACNWRAGTSSYLGKVFRDGDPQTTTLWLGRMLPWASLVGSHLMGQCPPAWVLGLHPAEASHEGDSRLPATFPRAVMPSFV